MRITPAQRDLIVRVAREMLGPQTRVRLFGSRVDNAPRRGDIDLLVETPEPLAHPLDAQLRLGARLERVLGGRRIDVLLVDPDTERARVHEVALAEGIEL